MLATTTPLDMPKKPSISFLFEADSFVVGFWVKQQVCIKGPSDWITRGNRSIFDLGVPKTIRRLFGLLEVLRT